MWRYELDLWTFDTEVCKKIRIGGVKVGRVEEYVDVDVLSIY